MNKLEKVDQLFAEEKYQELLEFYEKLIEREPENQSHYLYLGLIYLLKGEEEEAQGIWFSTVFYNEEENFLPDISELVNILDLEAQRQKNQENLINSWLIRFYIKEFQPENINNLLHFFILSILLQRFELEEIDRSNLIDLLSSLKQELELTNEHIDNLKVVLEYRDFLHLLPKNGTIAEIGVADGSGSAQILEVCQPKKLHLIDIWGSERYSQEMKKGVLEKIAREIKGQQVEINEGFSYDVLKTFPDDYFDWVYIDTDHTYETTAQELDLAIKKVKSDGIIAGHDYTVGNFQSGFPYGVIQAVHEFCAWYEWEMILLTHESHRHLSFALKKKDYISNHHHTNREPWRSLIDRNLLKETLLFLLFYFGNETKVLDLMETCQFFLPENCYCPVCGTFQPQFKPFGIIPRPNALCSNCSSLERHRMVWLYLKYETNLFSPTQKKMLHIAPEVCLAKNISQHSQIDYLTADLNYSAMVKMDITDIEYPDNSFDVIYCSHVLEHVPNDQQAIRELARVLKPEGWAILQVPIDNNLEKTFEDLTIIDPQEKQRLFGDPDHVRQYGLDYKNRLEEAGFQVKVVTYLDRFTKEQKNFYGINITKDDIYFCTLSSNIDK